MTIGTQLSNLDVMVESSCDTFEATIPNDITDDEYDELADAVGFDEDNILRKFEDDLEFCSLRRKIEIEEIAWLDLQGDGVWDVDSDPDNHFIDDEAERTLLSENAEVIIGNLRTGYIYYKFTNDEGSWIEVRNNDLAVISEIAQQINQGNIPNNNPNVTIVTQKKEESNRDSCKNKLRERKYEEMGGDRLKRVSKIRPAFGTYCNSSYCTSVIPSRIIVKTKGYKKKGGKWRSRRLWISAGINGANQSQSGFTYIDCQDEVNVHSFKEKRRRKVKVKLASTTFIPPVGVPRRYNHSVRDNKLFSYHRRGNLIINKDFYDM